MAAAFALAALLRLRRLHEDRAAAEVGRARSRASALAAERHQLIDRLGDHGHDARDVRGIAALAVARASTASMLGDLQALEQNARHEVEQAEAAHRAARRDALAVEKLEERHAERANVEELAAEQRALDELAGRPRPAGGGA